MARHRGPSCHERSLPALTPDSSGHWLVAALEEVPCAGDRAAYGAVDDHGDVLGSLDPIDDPAGGYLGVYDYGVHAPGQPTFQVSLGRSADLIHWTRLAVLDPQGASQPTLRQIPGQPGYLLAYEKHRPGQVAHSIRLRYYPSRAAVVGNRPAAQVDLPVRFSRYSNGTPAFLSIAWNGGLATSRIALSFHYETPEKIDREGVGVLTGFRHWDAVPATMTDRQLGALGFAGNHGDRRLFTIAGHPWLVYEAQRRPHDFSSWHVLIYDAVTKAFRPLTFTTASARAGASFGNPIVNTLRGPGGHGTVLAVTIFVFSSPRSAPQPGELVYYQPISAG